MIVDYFTGICHQLLDVYSEKLVQGFESPAAMPHPTPPLITEKVSRSTPKTTTHRSVSVLLNLIFHS